MDEIDLLAKIADLEEERRLLLWENDRLMKEVRFLNNSNLLLLSRLHEEQLPFTD